jgi:hypothetical protein
MGVCDRVMIEIRGWVEVEVIHSMCCAALLLSLLDARFGHWNQDGKRCWLLWCWRSGSGHKRRRASGLFLLTAFLYSYDTNE